MRSLSMWGAILLGALLVWGLFEIMHTPLETGEIYPPYSSLRADPLGAKALFESLSAQPNLTVERLYKERHTVHDPGAAILVLGIAPHSFLTLNEKDLKEYETLAASGRRLILAFLQVFLV